MMLSGIAFTLVGIVAGFWALFWDWPRGKKRCPKCWYNMTGTSSLVCSECGHKARTQRKQQKTRRRWRVVIACIVLIATGLGAIRMGNRKVGWREMVPTTLLIFLMPDLQKSKSGLYDELKNRMNKDELNDWQWEWIFDRCTNDLSQSPLVEVYARPVFNEDDPVEYLVWFGWLNTGVSWVDNACFDLELSFKGIFDIGHGVKNDIDIAQAKNLKLPGQANELISRVSATANQELIFDVDIEFQNDLFAVSSLNRTMANNNTYFTTTASGQVVIPNSIRHYMGRYSGPKLKRSYQLRVPIQFADSTNGSSLLKQIREHTQVVYTKSGVYLNTDSRTWGEPNGIILALKIEFIYKGTVTAYSRINLDIDGTSSSNIELLSRNRLNYKSLINGPEKDWSVRISGDDIFSWYVLEMPFRWDGEFELPLHLKIEAGKAVPIWSAENEMTFADLDEG